MKAFVLFLVLVSTVACSSMQGARTQDVQYPSLVWHANTEQDLEGYKLYRRALVGGSTWQLYTTLGLVTTYPLGPHQDGYEFSLTAFDTSQNESEKSNTVNYDPPPSDCSNTKVVGPSA